MISLLYDIKILLKIWKIFERKDLKLNKVEKFQNVLLESSKTNCVCVCVCVCQLAIIKKLVCCRVSRLYNIIIRQSWAVCCLHFWSIRQQSKTNCQIEMIYSYFFALHYLLVTFDRMQTEINAANYRHFVCVCVWVVESGWEVITNDFCTAKWQISCELCLSN